MNKKTYYVSVQAGTLLEEQGAAAFEFEIEATDEQVAQLSELFADKTDFDNASSRRAVFPAIPYHDDSENTAYDQSLQQIYRLIYEWGTPQTREHVQSMGILQANL